MYLLYIPSYIKSLSEQPLQKATISDSLIPSWEKSSIFTCSLSQDVGLLSPGFHLGFPSTPLQGRKII